jgi:hypothetical protein
LLFTESVLLVHSVRATTKQFFNRLWTEDRQTKCLELGKEMLMPLR